MLDVNGENTVIEILVWSIFKKSIIYSNINNRAASTVVGGP